MKTIFMVDIFTIWIYIVHTMVSSKKDINENLLEYQTLRLRDLIFEIVDCCEEQKDYLSKKFAIPKAEIRCLMLFDGKRYLTVGEITKALEVAKSRVTKLISGLTRRGLIKRIEDPSDARVKLLTLTAEGQKISEKIQEHQKSIHSQILLYMNTEDRNRLLSSLELLREAMEAVKKNLT